MISGKFQLTVPSKVANGEANSSSEYGLYYKLWTPRDEEKEFHPIIKEHSKEIFGEDSVYFDLKHKLTSKSNIAAIPDAYVVNLSKPYEWCIIENELAPHDVYDHIVPQVSKFFDNIEELETQKAIVDALDNEINQNEILKERIQEKTGQDTFRFLSELISRPPRIVIVINEVVPEIEKANRSLKRLANTEIVEFRTYTREGGSNAHAHWFKPFYFFEPVAKEQKSVAAERAWETRRSQVSITAEQILDKIENAKMKEMATQLRNAMKKISNDIEEYTTREYIAFRRIGERSMFSYMYSQKRGFWFMVKVPRNEFKINGLDAREQFSGWTHIRVNESTNLSLLVEAAKQAYER
jgi:predicted transport protein